MASRGIDWRSLPLWQKRGALAAWHSFEKVGLDPRRGEVTATRRRIEVDEELPAAEAWEARIAALCD